MEILVGLRKLHDGQAGVLSEADRFNVVACGRRWGKTSLGIDLALRAVLDGVPVAWGAPHYKFLAEPFREIKRRLGPVCRRSATDEKRLEALTGGSIDFWTLSDENAGRGHRYGLWVIDEAAMVPRLKSVFEEAIRPTLTDLGGSCWLLSTPKGRGFFWRLFERGRSGEAGWKSWQLPTCGNPAIDPGEVDSAKAMLPGLVFRREYLAEFVADEGRVFRGVLECVGKSRRVEPTGGGHRYVAGIDLGRLQDWTVVTVLEDGVRQVWFERMRGDSWERQVSRLSEVCSRFGCPAVVDATGLGDPVCEMLRAKGVVVDGVRFTSGVKEQLVQTLALALERGSLELLDEPVQTEELLNFGYESLDGRVRLEADHGHDDCVVALALALKGRYLENPRVLFGRVRDSEEDYGG